MSLARRSQSPSPGAWVHLYRFDATPVGGTVYYFTPGSFGGDAVAFGGVAYSAADVKFEGMEVSAGGSLPQPKVTIANTDIAGMVQGLLNAYGDLVGCEIRRVRVFEANLDNGSDPDPTAYIGPDVYRVERKSMENPIFVEWELSAAIDQEGAMIPRRQVIRDTCTLRYRVYDPTNPAAAGDGFVYDQNNPCPYTGASFFTKVDQTTLVAANDKCSYHLTGCKLRFGTSNPLPFGGFPGAARVRG